MATLRELRTQATELGITFEKTTNAAELQDMILGEMAKAEMAEADGAPPAAETPPPAPEKITPVRTPVTVAPPAESLPLAAPAPVTSRDDDPPTPASTPESFSESIEINEGDLNTEFKRQASLYASLARTEAVAKANVLAAKLRVEVVEAQQFKRVRKELLTSGDKATEKTIQSEVITSDEYQDAMQHLINATASADIAKGAKEAVAQRKDMLIQLGSSKRQEIDQIGMSIKDKVKEVLAASKAA